MGQPGSGPSSERASLLALTPTAAKAVHDRVCRKLKPGNDTILAKLLHVVQFGPIPFKNVGANRGIPLDRLIGYQSKLISEFYPEFFIAPIDPIKRMLSKEHMLRPA